MKVIWETVHADVFEGIRDNKADFVVHHDGKTVCEVVDILESGSKKTFQVLMG